MPESRQRDLVPLLAAASFSLLLVAGLGYWPAVREAWCPTILVASSQEKSDLLSTLAGQYSNEVAARNPGCSDPAVRVERIASGTAETRLADGWTGPDRPDAWMPAATTWVLLLAHKRPGLVPAGRLTFLAISPLVIAMPMPMAMALGWPEVQPSWSDLFSLARDPRGWAAHGHPEWGPFLLGKTDPNTSTSGLNSLLVEYYVASGQTAGLSEPDVLASEPMVRAVEGSVAHYCDTVDTCFRNLAAADDRGSPLSYISAMAAEEQEVANYNNGGYNNGTPPKVPLAAIYPTPYTLQADHPVVMLRWMSEGQREVADAFLQWLVQPSQQQQLANRWFRDGSGNLGSAVALTQGLQTAGPLAIAPLPAPAVIAAVQASWSQIRKRARVLILLDTASKDVLAQVRKATQPFASGDSIAVWSVQNASTPYRQLVGFTPGDSHGTLDGAIKGAPLQAARAPVYAATYSAYLFLGANQSPGLVNAVVLIADTPDDGSLNIGTLLQAVVRNGGPVRVYTVSLNGSMNKDLQRLARASGGVYVPASGAPAIQQAVEQALADF